MALVTKLKPARAYPSVNGVHAIRAHINQKPYDPNDVLSCWPSRGEFSLVSGVAVHIGTLPKGCCVLPAAKHVIVAFNGTTPAIIVGNLADPAAYLTSALIAPGAIAFAGGLVAAGMGYTADETPVYIKMTAAGNTLGRLDLVVPFYAAQD
jgi:hypothetical protein